MDKARLSFSSSRQCCFTIPRTIVVIIALVPLAARGPGTAAVAASSSLVVPLVVSVAVSVAGSRPVRVARSVVVVHCGGGKWKNKKQEPGTKKRRGEKYQAVRRFEADVVLVGRGWSEKGDIEFVAQGDGWQGSLSFAI